MEDQLEKLVSTYQDLYTAPTEERTSELEFKLLEMEWEGEFVTAPPVVAASTPGIPILVLTRRSSLREWEVDLDKNAVVIYSDLERGTIGSRPLYKPPTKAMKPQSKPEPRGRKPEVGEGHVAGAIRHLVGESLPEPLSRGEYAITVITWDYHSNQRRVRKEGPSKPVNPVDAAAEWPWDRWVDTHAFKMSPDSPVVEGEDGLGLKVEGVNVGRKLLGAMTTKARSVHIISPVAKHVSYSEIHAGIHVYLLLFTLDKYPPKSIKLSVPILGSTQIKVGDQLNGWFSMPFPFEPSSEDRMLYAVADGKITGPIKILGEKP